MDNKVKFIAQNLEKEIILLNIDDISLIRVVKDSNESVIFSAHSDTPFFISKDKAIELMELILQKPLPEEWKQ